MIHHQTITAAMYAAGFAGDQVAVAAGLEVDANLLGGLHQSSIIFDRRKSMLYTEIRSDYRLWTVFMDLRVSLAKADGLSDVSFERTVD